MEAVATQKRRHEQAVRLERLANLYQGPGQIVEPVKAQAREHEIEGGSRKGQKFLIPDDRPSVGAGSAAKSGSRSAARSQKIARPSLSGRAEWAALPTPRQS